jgi:MFS family permease
MNARDRCGVGRSALYALVGAYGVSVAGTAMSAVAIPWLVLSTTGSAARTGIVGFAEMAPYVLAQVLSGPLVDRIGATRACVAGNAAAALLVGAIPGLFAVHRLGFALLVALVAAGGAVRGLADTATGPLVPATATRAAVAMERAAGVYSGAARTGLLIGAPLAGVVVAAVGAPAAVLVDGVSFAVAAVVIAVAVPSPSQSDRPTAEAGTGDDGSGKRGSPAGQYLANLGAGLRFLRTDRLLLGLILLVAASNLLDQALLSVLVPVWVRSRLHNPAVLGLLGGVSNVGALLGVLAATWLGPRLPRRVTFSLGYLLGFAPPFFALAAWHTLAPVLIVLGGAGMAGGIPNPIIGAVSYERIPEPLRARALGAIKASAWIGIPFGSLLGGALADRTGVTTALISTGAVMLLVSLSPLLFPAWRQLNIRPSTDMPTVATH